MKHRSCKSKPPLLALGMVVIGLLILLFCLPPWLFCCIFAAVLIAAGMLLLRP